jgi:PIN domain nuclease of toxin-antitoxin system
VLDASAILAVLQREPGAQVVVPLLDGAAISAVNWSETIQKAISRDVSIDGLRADIEALGVSIVPFTAVEAEQAAALWLETMHAGLSLGDRACLALARREGVPALTADRSWSSVAVGVDVRVVR